MKNREKAIFLLSSVFIVFKGLLIAQEDYIEDPRYEWFEGYEVAAREDGIYTDSNKGMMKLNVVEYDEVNNRYKVLCSYLQRHELDSSESLGIPHED